MKKKKAKKVVRKPSKSTKKTPKAPRSGIMPLGDRVLVRPFTEEDLRQAEGKRSALDFILPESVTKEKSAQGKVLAVGAGKFVDGKLQPIQIKVGDTVIFSKYSYDEVEQGEEQLYLLREENILAVVK